MQPEQIKNAAVEVLGEILKNPQPASEILNTYTRSRRYIGSKDRRALADMVWGVLRAWRRLDYAHPNADIGVKIEAYMRGDYERPEAPEAVLWEVPAWMPAHVENSMQELPALIEAAPTVLRANGNREKIATLLAAEGIETQKTALSVYGLILQKRCNLNESAVYKKGLIEVQDEGSQMVALATGIGSEDRVLDYCAGAGGKSLIFAQMMQGRGMIVAHDISRRSLEELKKRAERAGVKNIITCEKIKTDTFPKGFSHVVVDAPCSGTGTWRRCPDARLKLTEKQVADLVQKQRTILSEAVSFVGAEGYLSYMTCSILRDENTCQAEWFLKENPAFSLVSMRQFSPATSGTDGLFVAVFKKG